MRWPDASRLAHLGGLGAFGLTLSDALRLGEGPGRGRRAGLVVRQGEGLHLALPLRIAPAACETFDPKPEALEEIRGEMKSIATVVPGLNICEGLPRIAQVMDRVTVVRSDDP